MTVKTRRLLQALTLIVVAGVLAAAPAAIAGGQRADRVPAAPAGDDAALKAQIESVFTVVGTRDGVILVPRVARAGVQSVEVSGGSVAIDGRLVTGAELRGRLGRDAALVAALSYYDGERLRQLFAQPQTERTEEPRAAPSEPAVAEAPERVDQQGSDETRRYSRHTESRVGVGRTVRVERDERVRSAVVVIGGSAEIDGYVGDTVVVVGGSLRLGRESEVHGDVVVVGGTMDRHPGARVDGEVNVVDIGLPRFDIGPLYPRHWLPDLPRWRATPAVGLFGTLTRLIVFGLLAALLVLVAGRAVGRIERTAVREPWKAGAAGLLAELIILPLLVLTVVILVISIIGIPLLLLVPFAVLVIVVGFFLGFAGVAVGIGRALVRRLSGAAVLPALLAGLAVIWGLALIGRVLMLAGWPLQWVASLALGLGFLIEYVAWTIGFGAVLLSRFGTRDRHPTDEASDLPPYSPPPSAVDLTMDGPSGP